MSRKRSEDEGRYIANDRPFWTNNEKQVVPKWVEKWSSEMI